MPTYFGPTNIPPLEAFYLKVPVIHSNLEIFKEQIENKALMVDLKNPDHLAKQLIRTIKRDPEIESMIEKAYLYVNSWDEDKFWNGLKRIFDQYSIILNSWKS